MGNANSSSLSVGPGISSSEILSFLEKESAFYIITTNGKELLKSSFERRSKKDFVIYIQTPNHLYNPRIMHFSTESYAHVGNWTFIKRNALLISLFD